PEARSQKPEARSQKHRRAQGAATGVGNDRRSSFGFRHSFGFLVSDFVILKANGAKDFSFAPQLI
ncbi:MAG TPA: hypothetical protein VHM91_01170, partial [Verrucomicrobiales bacterium]|nr:hypothetical protein [Verrucomicrobiales bacterium]